MNSLLAELQKEREERRFRSQDQDAEKETSGIEPGKLNAESAVNTQPSSRKRKQSNPVRRVPGGGDCAAEEAQPGRDTLDHDKKDKSADEKVKKSSKDKGEEASNDTKPAKKKTKIAPARASEGSFNAPEGAEFDAASVAAAWALGDFTEGRTTYGEMAYDQFASAARVHAASNGMYEGAHTKCVYASTYSLRRVHEDILSANIKNMCTLAPKHVHAYSRAHAHRGQIRTYTHINTNTHIHTDTPAPTHT
jgi:hypothetical protein